jgi:hypothetical protein
MNKTTIVTLTALIIIATTSASWWIWSTTQPQNKPIPINTPIKQLTNVTLGIITDSAEDKQKFEFIANYALDEVNEYAANQGNLTRFNYISEHAADIYAINAVGDLHRTKNVTIFLGFDISEAMCASLGYARSNGVILLGIPEVHHPSSALPGDEMFRITPNLREITYATESLVKQLGGKGILFITRDRGWGDEIFGNLAENRTKISEIPPAYDGLRGVRYSQDTINSTYIVSQAETIIGPLIERYGVNNTVIVMVGGEEWITIFRESAYAKGLLNVPWVVVELSEDPYVTEGYLPDPTRMQDIGIDQTRIISLKREPFLDNEKYKLLQAAYAKENPAAQQPLGIKDASFYDSVWVACLSVLEANSTDGRILRDVIPRVASGYSGASGRIVFDVNGDRSVDYYFYEATDVGGTVSWVKVGSYDAVTLQSIIEVR